MLKATAAFTHDVDMAVERYKTMLRDIRLELCSMSNGASYSAELSALIDRECTALQGMQCRTLEVKREMDKELVTFKDAVRHLESAASLLDASIQGLEEAINGRPTTSQNT